MRHIHVPSEWTLSCTYIDNLPTSVFQKGLTALHLASWEGHVAVVHLLIEAHAVINQQSKVEPGIHYMYCV